jgi:hypothetical protein
MVVFAEYQERKRDTICRYATAAVSRLRVTFADAALRLHLSRSSIVPGFAQRCRLLTPSIRQHCLFSPLCLSH